MTPRRATWLQMPAALLVIVFAAMLSTAALLPAREPRQVDAVRPLSIAVIGDSFTAGEFNGVVWPTLLAQRTGWTFSNFALPDAGFAADGRGGHAFTHQVDRALAAHPSVILIVAGQADNGVRNMDVIAVGVRDALNKATRSGSRVLVVGPTWYESPVPEQVVMVSATVARIAEETGVPFLRATNPPWLDASQMGPNLRSPNDAGQSAIADEIAAWLPTELVT